LCCFLFVFQDAKVHAESLDADVTNLKRSCDELKVELEAERGKATAALEQVQLLGKVGIVLFSI